MWNNAGGGAAGETPDNTQPAETNADAPATEATAEEAPAEDAGEEVAESDYDPYQVITDDAGNPIDLGGMEIIIRDWWSGDPTEPANEYEEALQDYRDFIHETYNFTIKQQAMSDWGSTPTYFVDYATTGGDENYIFTLRDDPAITSAMSNEIGRAHV